MSSLFVDTSGWASFLVREQPFHRQAVSFIDRASNDGRVIVTTNYVMAELVALLTSPLRVPRREQVRILETLRCDRRIDIRHIDQVQDQAA